MARIAAVPDEAYRAIEDIVGADNVSRTRPSSTPTPSSGWPSSCGPTRATTCRGRPPSCCPPAPRRSRRSSAWPTSTASRSSRTGPAGTTGPRRQGRRTHAAVRPAAHGPHPRDRREEHVRDRRAVRDRAQLQAEVIKLGLNLNITGVGCSSSIVASACAYHGAGPEHLLHGRQRRERARHGMGHARGRDPAHRLAGLRRRLVLQRGPRPERAGHLPRDARLPRRTGRLHQVRRSSSRRTSARPSGRSRARCRATACRCPRTCASTRSPCPPGTPGPTSTTRSTTTGSATSSTASSTSPAPTSPRPSG